MKPRQKCIGSCGKHLIAFQGHHLHPNIPCNGVKDSIFIEAEIKDEMIQEKFMELYGKPEMDDYKRLGLLEGHKSLLIKELRKRDNTIKFMKEIIDEKDNKFNLPIKYWISKIFKRK